MDLGDDAGTRERQEIVVAAEILGVGAQPLAPEVRLIQGVGLDHRPHGAIEDEDALRERGAKLGQAVLSIGHR